MGSDSFVLLNFSRSGKGPQLNINSQLKIPRLYDPFSALYAKFFHEITSISGTTANFLFSFSLANIGSSHPYVASQWESRNTNTSPFALSAPYKRACVNPIRFSDLRSLTFGNFEIYSSNCVPR